MNHEGRMYREGDPDTSIEAAEHVDATRLEAMVLEVVSKYPNGCIQDDVLNAYRGMPYSSITARFISKAITAHVATKPVKPRRRKPAAQEATS